MGERLAVVGKFEIGRVVRGTFSSIGADLPVILGISAVLVAAPAALLAWIDQTFLADQQISASLAKIVLGLFVIALEISGQTAVIYTVLGGLNGRRPTFGEAADQGFRHMWPVFLIIICTTFMTALGSIGLVVPGLMLLVRWIVAIPTRVAEKTGVFASMKRSAELTKGRRWSIFGLLAISGLIIVAFEAVLVTLIVHPTEGLAAGFTSPVMRLFVTPAISLITTPLFSAGYASLYHELRSTREGDNAEKLAAVFA